MPARWHPAATREMYLTAASDLCHAWRMANEDHELVTLIKPVTPAFRSPHVVAIAGFILIAGSVAIFFTGHFWITVILAAVAFLALSKYSQIRTGEHEQLMSVPPGLLEMKQRLGSLNLEPALAPIATRAQGQLQRLEGAMMNASGILVQKLDPGELAFKRFQTTLRSGAAAILTVLQDCVEHLKQASVIGSKDPQAESSKTAASRCLDQNEKALEAFMLATASIAAMETSSARIDLPQAVQELQSIAARAKNLSVRQEAKDE